MLRIGPGLTARAESMSLTIVAITKPKLLCLAWSPPRVCHLYISQGQPGLALAVTPGV